VELKGEMVRDEILQWWRRATVGVLCSHSEGMPISLIEAAACAVPAVATAVGGIPELVDHGVSGLLIPPRDTAALADALSRIVTQPALRQELGQAARRRAVEKFSLSRQVDRLMALWQSILERSARPRAEAR
jgi:glycosyltransferase involved in cell wall biosynthesis